ncbi:MAG: hypothetical protein ACE5RI_00110 [Candidatus Nitrosomaritimum yanchengensis]
MDKNHNQALNQNISQIQSEFSGRNPNFVLSSNPFVKTEFLHKLVESMNLPVFFLDCDLLYSGYVASGIIKKNDKLKFFVTTKSSLNNDIKQIIKKIENEKSLIILDSLNGLYNMFDELEYVRFINSTIMLLSTVAKYSKSIIIITGMARKNKNKEFVLSPTGRQIVRIKKAGFYELGSSETSLILNLMENTLENKRPYEISK